jgi:hypothetical protein
LGLESISNKLNCMKNMEFKNKTDIINFGKYNGQTIDYVYKTDINYFNWCIGNIKGFKIEEKLLDSLKNNVADDISEVVSINSLKELQILVEKTISLLTEKKIYSNLFERDYSVFPEIDKNDIINWAIKHNLLNNEKHILEASIKKIDIQAKVLIMQLQKYLLKNGIKGNQNSILFIDKSNVTGYDEIITLSGNLSEDQLTLTDFNLAYQGELIQYSFDLPVE